MGWASRAGEGREKLEVKLYIVRRWTAFEWTFAEGADKDDVRKDRTDHLKRAASMIERQLLRKFPDSNATVKQVKVKKEPQLLFQINVTATDEDDAVKRAAYRIERALSVRIPTGNMVPARDRRGRTSGGFKPEKVTLRPPWGKTEVQPPSGRRNRVAA